MKLTYIFIFFILIQCSYSQAQKDARYPGDEMRQIGNQLRKKINSINKKLDNTLVPGLKQNDINFDWKNTEEYKMIQIMDRCLVNDDRFVCNPYYKKALKYKETISNKVKRNFYNKNW